MLLDIASNGNFLNKDVASGWELVKNLAQFDGNYCDEYDRSIRGNTYMKERHKRDIQALHAKIDKLVISLPRPIVERPIHNITDEEQHQIQEGGTYPYEEVSYIQNQGG